MSWKRTTLKAVLSSPIRNGYSPVCPENPTGKWILSLGALNGYGLDPNQVKPAPNDDKKVGQYFLSPGDFLVSRSNTRGKVGRSAMFKGELERCAYPDLMMRFRVDASKVLPEFLEVYLRGDEALRHLQSSASGTSGSMVKITKNAVEKLSVPIPEMATQKAIAETTRTWEKGLNCANRLLDARRNQLEWFRTTYLTGSKRVDGFKKQWTTLRLKDILTEHGETSIDGEEVYSVSVHRGLVNQIEHLGRSFAAATTDHYNLVKPGDIVYTKSPTGDFPLGIIKQSKVDKNVIVSPLYGVFKPKTRDLGVLLDCYFESPANAFNYLHPIVQRGAKNTISITNKRFLSNSLLLPTDPEEQKALAGFVELAKWEIRLLERQVEAYRRQKRGLMQKLLTGEWRIR